MNHNIISLNFKIIMTIILYKRVFIMCLCCHLWACAKTFLDTTRHPTNSIQDYCGEYQCVCFFDFVILESSCHKTICTVTPEKNRFIRLCLLSFCRVLFFSFLQPARICVHAGGWTDGGKKHHLRMSRRRYFFSPENLDQNIFRLEKY